ncbi:MAG: GNAT family N-acetyltransferase [Alphaproteobacteria bacterium]|nr:GNAT family N-acetyltransferase [Alphaproteobacteria bacterium]OJV15716.1 MAG: hypothetical protein BGO27_07355 [Alphaproteobacteria bacterium 33-17]
MTSKLKHVINVKLISSDVASDLCKRITIQLPEYFGIMEANENYFNGIFQKTNFAAKYNNEYVGLLSLEFPYSNNSNVYWMGILPNYHNKGIGKKLLQYASKYSLEKGTASITVETLSPNQNDHNYYKTYQFYRSFGFHPLFNIKPLNYEWEMVYMIKILKIQ